jgi:myo-inositol-1(or 4)-monophosphatase
VTADLDLPALLRAAEHAADAGGSIVAGHFGAAGNVREKAPGDWVSDVDTSSEAAVRESLERDWPSLPVFGEEGGGVRGDVGWLVDPLDGTANFLHGFPAVGVSVALVEHGVPVVGVVHAPLLGITYTAYRGGGAFSNGEQMTVSARDAERAICATGFPFRAKAELLDEYLPVFEAALRRFEDLRRAGSASLDLAWTAAGVFDGYFEQALGPWDVAAGALLVREAGGVVTDWSGDDRAWLMSGDIVAGSPTLHAALLELTRTTC